MKGEDNIEEKGVIVRKVKQLSEDEISLQKTSPLDGKFSEPNEEKKEEEYPPVSYIQLFRYSTPWERFVLFIGILCGMGTGICQPLNMLLFGSLTGTMVDYGSGSANITTSPDIPPTSVVPPEIIKKFTEGINNFAIYNAIIGAAMLILSYISVMSFNYIAQNQIYRIRSTYLKSALRQDIGWYDLHQSGDFASRMAEDLSKLEEGLGEKVVMYVNFMTAFLSSLILALVKGWELALICLISLPITMASMGLIAIVSARLAKQELGAYGKAGTIAEEVLSSMRTVIAFDGQGKEVERYKNNLVFAKNINIKRNFFSALGFGLLWFFIYASYALAFWYGVGLILKERGKNPDDIVYSPATMVTVFFSVMVGSMNLGMGSPYIESFSIAKGAAAKVFSVIERVSPIDSMSEEGDKLPDVQGTITFKNVQFEYPSRKDVQILKGLNITINKGETVALVGSSGCGKSTCIQLIQRFYDPREGSVELDGHDIQTLNIGWLRSHIGVVGQEPVLFQTTIAENIRYGRDGVSLEEIHQAARLANAHDFITKLPQGYDTLVGERGAQISGGQKQRIAIARALVRKPKILLLDEATSALDTGSEAKVQAALDQASIGRTTIIVAHRLSTIRNADKIVVISGGQVVEQGTHDDLIKLKGHYFGLVMAQVSTTGDLSSEEVSNHSVLERMVSITSTSSSKAGDFKTEEIANIAEESDADVPKVRMLEILKMNKKEWPHIVFGTLCSIVMGCAMPVFAILFGDILGVLAKPSETEVRTETNLYSILFAVTGVAVGLATFFQIYLYGIAGEKLTMRVRSLAFGAMVKQEIAWFDDKANNTGALCARLSGEASSVQGATGQRVGTIFQSISTVVLGVTLAMYYEWRLGLVALCFTPILLVSTYFQASMMMGDSLNNQSAMEKATKFAVEAVGNIRTVVGLSRENMFHQQYLVELKPAHIRAKRNTHIRGLVYGIAQGMGFFAFSACMYYGGELIKNEGLPYSSVFKVSQSLLMGTMSIGHALAFAPNFQKGMVAAAKIFNLLKRQPKIVDPVNPAIEKWKADGNVDYSSVEFFYPTRANVQVLKGLNLKVNKGHTVALVGPSGCGKSTCIQLLERFYDPDAGKVSLDEYDISSVRMSLLRSHLGIVSQEPVLFDRTIAENIAYGDNSREVSMQEIIEAAKKANIHNFISSLPQGYDTRMGEKGTQLSGGQKQRVAIARALVRNPRVLLLDEATSALDTESEKVVQEALDKAKEGRTCITIAHRLSTIQDADVICVINQGRVDEIGTHNQLMSLQGLYYKLQKLQSGKR